MKNLLLVGVGLVLLGGLFVFMSGAKDSAPTEETAQGGERAVVSDGTYEVVAEESEVGWAGKKPLLEGYVNSGSIAVTSGTITVLENQATGSFAIDMDTLSVSSTPTKPGSENALEGHLKGERWFNVATYPEASFEITNVATQADSDATFTYDVTGNLTMKGQTHEVSFPAMIYADMEGRLHARAETEIDRTVWGITSGSGSFFDDLADNVIDDMVALSFHVIAVKQ